jgi:thiamine-phosphate pyrophosphorylase
LLAISNRRRTAVEAWVASLVRGGIRWLLLREKDLEDRPLADLAGRCRELAGGGALVMISGRADLCRAAGLAGVHLPAHGPPTARVRSILGDGALIGRSTHTQAEVELAAAEGADYVVFGPVFPPLSKPAAGAAQGLEALATAARASIPVYALGGLTLDRLEAVAATGAAGAAGITLFTDAARIGTLARRADELFRRRSSSNPPAEGTSR